MQSGVVVVVAAGNTGYGFDLDAEKGNVAAGLALTINDPGNAEAAITVGSTHRGHAPPLRRVVLLLQGPHRRRAGQAGPRRAGRAHPLRARRAPTLAKIVAKQDEPAALDYVEDSGTSMAAAHVSGHRGGVPLDPARVHRQAGRAEGDPRRLGDRPRPHRHRSRATGSWTSCAPSSPSDTLLEGAPPWPTSQDSPAPRSATGATAPSTVATPRRGRSPPTRASPTCCCSPTAGTTTSDDARGPVPRSSRRRCARWRPRPRAARGRRRRHRRRHLAVPAVRAADQAAGPAAAAGSTVTTQDLLDAIDRTARRLPRRAGALDMAAHAGAPAHRQGVGATRLRRPGARPAPAGRRRHRRGPRGALHDARRRHDRPVGGAGRRSGCPVASGTRPRSGRPARRDPRRRVEPAQPRHVLRDEGALGRRRHGRARPVAHRDPPPGPRCGCTWRAQLRRPARVGRRQGPARRAWRSRAWLCCRVRSRISGSPPTGTRTRPARSRASSAPTSPNRR